MPPGSAEPTTSAPRESGVEVPGPDAILEGIFASGAVGFGVVDPGGRIVRAHARWLESIQRAAEDVVGRDACEVLPGVPEDTRRHLARARAGEVVDLPERRQVVGGGEAWYADRLSPLPLPSGAGVLVTSWDVTGARRATQALRDEHESLRRHVESTPLALVEWDGDYRVVGYSRRAEEMFGFAPEEVLGKRIDEIPWVPEEEWPSVRAIMRDMRTAARPANVNANRNRRKDGSTIYCEWYNSALHDAAGRLVSILSLVLDVTPRTRVEEAHRASEARARAVMDNVRDHLVVLEAIRDGAGAIVDWRYVDANERAMALLGFGRALLGRTLREVLGERADRHAEMVRVLESGAPARYESPFADRILLVTLFRLDAERIASASVDITDRKHAEERAEFLARFPEENPDPVLRLSSDLGIAYANPAARQRLGGLGVSPGARAPPPLAEAAQRALLRGRRTRAELESAGSVYSVSVMPVGREVNVYAQEITDRKTAEAALRTVNERLRETDRRKDEFLAMLSHELRNPLAPIRNAVAILDRASPTGEQAARARAVIGRQVDHLTRIVDDLLDVTRIARGRIELRRVPVDLVEVVRRAAEDHRPLMYGRGVSLGVALPEGPAWVLGDATRLAQVLGNLLQNAAKFTGRGGRVAVSLGAEGDWAEVRVADTGIGVEPALLARIFEPFVQADVTLARTQGGLGLGLALVKGIAELHGGAACAESAGPGKGTEFVVRLPVIPAPRPVAGGVGTAQLVRRRRILVVDDNRDAAESLAEILSLMGHETEVAFDGPSALERAQASPPDVVLCDIGLPGMSGYDVARELRARHARGVKLFAVSGYAQPEDVERAHAAGFDGHVAKPPDPDLLVRLLEA